MGTVSMGLIPTAKIYAIARERQGKEPVNLPETTMLGALTRYVSDESVTDFQPMGSNMGILPGLDQKIRDKQERYQQIAERAMRDLAATDI